MDIYYCGIEGSYTYMALKEYIKKNKLVANIISTNNFEDLFYEKYFFIPLKNNIGGYVIKSLYLLNKNNHKIINNIKYKVEHYLLINKNTTINNIKHIISHPQAFKQCSFILNKYKWNHIYTNNTAFSSKYIYDNKLKDTAVIASIESSILYNLKPVIKLNNFNTNITSFLFIENE